MKVLIKKEPKKGLWMGEQAKPDIGPNDVLIKIDKTAICGTDLHIYNWDQWSQKNIKTPLTIGHEFVGRIAELGSAVTGLQVGERVSGEGHITCTHCRNCRAGKRHLCRNTVGIGVHKNGAFAEYLALPAVNAFRLDDNIPDDIGAIFDPYGNAAHTALSFDLVGEDVFITGAGPIGIMAVAIAKHVGARHVVISDINDYRLNIAKKMGATEVFNPKGGSIQDIMAKLGMTEGFDVGFEMSGNAQAYQTLLNSMNNGARVALLGIFPEDVAIDWSQVIFKGLVLKGIYGREMFETWYKMSSMLQSGLDLSPVISHHFAVDDFEKGFQCMQDGQAAKVILNWT